MRNKKHIVIDIETLDTSPTSVILQIAACSFDINNSGNILSQFCINVDRHSQPNRTISPSTEQFWSSQPVEKREALLTNTMSLDEALASFRAWLPPNMKDYCIWANSPNFDISILDNAYNYTAPWKYWQLLDIRTFVQLARSIQIDIPPPDESKKHGAIYDCHYEAMAVSMIYTHIAQGYLYG